jgi:hypothetical protein
MNREKSSYFVAIFGLPPGVEPNGVQGGVNRFESKTALNEWISENGVISHPAHGVDGMGILPDGRAVQIFHGRIKGLISKVEIG